MNKLIVISGCSGGGKSTLLEEFKTRGYSIIPEAGREIVKEQSQINDGATPWEKPVEFCQLMIERSVENYKKIMNVHQTVFFDRSFLDSISYYQTLPIDEAQKYDYLIQELRFYPVVFFTPPWPEIYVQDNERKHSFEEAVVEYKRLIHFYPECSYKIIELPKVSVQERVKLIESVIL